LDIKTIYRLNFEFFLQITKERFRHISNLLRWISIAKNLHKLQICLRFYSFYKKLDIQPYKNLF